MSEAIQYTFIESAQGRALAAFSQIGLCGLLLGDSAATLIADARQRFGAEIERNDRQLHCAAEQVKRLIAPSSPPPSQPLSFPLDLQGTDFQQRVWQALQTVPFGTTLSYGALAQRLGKPTAVRAVASACGANPVAIVVPCHRILRGDGSLGGYRWGLERKRKLLALEGSI